MPESTSIGSEANASVSTNPQYGPSRDDPTCGYSLFSTPKALTGYSGKILKDLTKWARLYSGREVRIFAVTQGERCPRCTNTITGERLLSNCPQCNGTGYVDKWERIGDFWTFIDFGPRYQMATQFGNTENPNGVKEQIIILGAPLLKDQSIVIFKESREVYKIYDILPHIVAMRGDVVAQIASTTRLTPGVPEYGLIDW